VKRRLFPCLCALSLCSLALAAQAGAAFGPLPGEAGFSAKPLNGSSPARQAGSHPLSLRTEINLELGPEDPGEPGVPVSEGDLKQLSLELPGGLVENPSAVSQCSQAQFHAPRGETPFEDSLSGESCPDKSQVGTVAIRSSYGGGTERTFGLFNLDPPPGAPSELGVSAYGAPIVFVPEVRQSGGEYGLTLVARNVPQAIDIHGLTLEVWGTPWAVNHDAQRGNCLNEAEPSFGWAKCSVGSPKLNPHLAYLTLPTSCEASLPFVLKARSWQEPAKEVTATYGAPGLQECEGLRFEPNAQGIVSNPRASSPTGFDFRLNVNNEGFLNPERQAPSPVRNAVITLPEGMTINPSVGAGLKACSPAQYAAETPTSPPGAGCPNESKIGDFTVKTPLFEETVEGAIFLAAPYDNPFGSLIAVYLVAKAAGHGILVKVAGRLDADANSGTLTASFDGLPQLPYTDLLVHFREGQRSPLATPGRCGDFSTQMQLTPWNSSKALGASSAFLVTSGSEGTPCPSGTPPFNPKATGGTLNSNAGSYSPFYLHLTRKDTEQEITSYSATFPPGMTGKIAGIPYCPEADIARAKQNSGFAEEANPSCPASSEIGHTIAGYGLGPVLTYAPGKLYLAGPFHGSTFSIVAIDSATVGPFDLGTVIVRSAIKVDPQTAQVSIDSQGSDPIPHIIDGIPIHLRDIRVYISKRDLTLNPTSCAPSAVASTLKGSGAVFSDPGDDQSATATAPFQAFNCGALQFRPKISLRLLGGTKHSDYPALRVEVKPRTGDSNIAKAQVALPPSEFLAQNHIENVCTRPQYAREACPSDSVIGHARAFTPLLDKPLEGDVYLRSSSSVLPDMAVALRERDKGISVDLIGKIDSFHGGLRGTFNTVPDAPVSKFVMKLRGGKHGPIQNSEDACAATGQNTIRFSAHNSLGLKGHLPLVAPCGKHKGKKHHHKGKAKKSKGGKK
jgi:hypothetical protein